MPLHLGPLEITCDAPPYPIIQACRRLGLREPEDVRWCRYARGQNEVGPSDPPNIQAWKSLLGVRSRKGTCSCGQGMPVMERCTFTFITGREVSYYLGQCGRCRTIYWDEA